MRILLATDNPPLAILIKRALARFQYDWVQVRNGFDAFQKSINRPFDLVLLEYDLPRMKALEILKRYRSLEGFHPPPMIIFTLSEKQRHSIEKEHFPRVEVVSRPIAIRQFVSLVQQILHQGTRLACLGGGTGLFTLLAGLKTLSGVSLTSIVSMSDDGGSTGVLKDMFGILPPGDIRRSLVALSTAPDLLNELMQYRFSKGEGLKGHNLGNLLLTALSQMRGSLPHAVKSLSEILNIQGQVIPVTETLNTLKAELENGHVIEGESRIDLYEAKGEHSRIKRLWQDPPVEANPDVLEAIHNAHFILLGPGDLYTSLISNLIVGGIPEAVTASQAKKIYICNIMTEPGETNNFSVADHIKEINKYLKKDCLDYIVCSSTKFSKQMLETYAKKDQNAVVQETPEALKEVTQGDVVWSDVASEKELVRHDSLKLANVIKKIVELEKGK